MFVKIIRPFELGAIDRIQIFIIDDKNPMDRAAIQYDDKSGLLNRQSLPDNDPQVVKPLLQLPDHMFDAFLKAMVEYANETGVKLDSESVLLGKLEAMSLHLEDMRKIAMHELQVPKE